MAEKLILLYRLIHGDMNSLLIKSRREKLMLPFGSSTWTGIFYLSELDRGKLMLPYSLSIET